MAQRMDVDPVPTRKYPLFANSFRIAAFIFTTEKDTPYGRADYLQLAPMWEHKFGCRIRCCVDPTIAEFWQFIFKLKQEINRHGQSHDYLSITFIGHGGRRETIYGRDTYSFEYFSLKDGNIRIIEVVKKFKTSDCFGLAGCPIFIFVQACRGDEEEIPSELVTRAAAISQYQDYYILNSCVEGTTSFYDAISGESYFLRKLKEVFEDEYHRTDIVNMGSHIIGEMQASLPPGYAQTIQATNTLTKAFHFNAPTAPMLETYGGAIARQTAPVPFPVTRRATDASGSDGFQLDVDAKSLRSRLQPKNLVAQEGQKFNDAASSKLFWAAGDGCDAAEVDRHLADGANINYQSFTGSTPLHGAAHEGYQHTVSALLARGADPRIKDEFGETPLDWARNRGKQEVITLLEEALKIWQ